MGKARKNVAGVTVGKDRHMVLTCCFSYQSSGCVLDSEGLIKHVELQLVS